VPYTFKHPTQLSTHNSFISNLKQIRRNYVGRAKTANSGGQVVGTSDVDATITELVMAFPAAFTHDPVRVQPLKLGIKDDLYARSDISHRRITAALRSYCNSVNYLAVLKQGTVRVDLAGQPTGNVTEAQAKHAAEVLKALAKTAPKQGGKAASDPRVTQAPATTKWRSPPLATASVSKRSMIATEAKMTIAPIETGPRRLSLADLQKAAAARKGKS
jgi:ProP effector